MAYVERLLDRISNGVLPEDRRTDIAELQFVVAESRVAQLAFGAMGFPVLLSVLKEECDDVEMEAILTIPCGITRLMDMLMDREVIRNEALLLLTYLTHEAKEIQKILVFEGAFEKIFSIIKEEGCSEGVVVQDCLELLNNLIRNNASNQVLLRETMGFDPLISILKLRGSSYSFTQRRTINLLSALETIGLLIMRGPEIDTGKDANRLTNKAVSVQELKANGLLFLCGVRRTKNLDALASKVLGKEPQVEPTLNSILRIILRTSSMQEFVAADYVFKCFCEKNLDGQAMLASTLIPQSQPTTHALRRIMLLHGLTLSQNDGDLETCSRAASVLSHVLKDNMQCKERVLRIELEEPTPSLGAPEPLLHRVVKYLALATCMKNKEGKPNASGNTYVQAIILKLLLIEDVEENEVAVVCNATLAEDLAKIGRGGSSQPKHRSSGGSERVLLETLHRDLQEASQWLDTLKTKRTKIESEASMYCNLAGKMESNLKSLSDAYNSLEQENLHLEKEIKALNCGEATPIPDVEAIKAEAREETQKESEAGLNDLLVCLRQEQSKVEKLSVRLLELGEDVDKLLEGIGDDIGLLEDAEVEEDG
ncbi:unnamed protein product [Camellia sinensis]